MCVFSFAILQVSAKELRDQWFEDSSQPVQGLSLYLNNLSPFSDIVVIQRRYLVKTGRFEISPSALLLFSNEFFINAGVGGNLAFYFLEKHGLEIRSFYTHEFQRSALRDIAEKLSFRGSIVGYRTTYFLGLVYKWIPIYGKMTWFDNKIIPFEMSFFLGGGVTRVLCPRREAGSNTPEYELVEGGVSGGCTITSTEKFRVKGEEFKRLYLQRFEPTVLFGIGQSYALSRNIAFRLDLNWQYYGQLIGGPPFHHWDALMTSGISFYFPRRKVR